MSKAPEYLTDGRYRFRVAGLMIEVARVGELFSTATPCYRMVPVDERTVRPLGSSEAVMIEGSRMHPWGMTAEPVDPVRK